MSPTAKPFESRQRTKFSTRRIEPLFYGDNPSLVWPDPTPEMLQSPAFEAVWQRIKTWDINVPEVYGGYMGATGNHVRAILDALKPFLADSARLDKLERYLRNAEKHATPGSDHPGFVLTERAGLWVVMSADGGLAKPTLREAIDDAEEMG